MPARFGAPMAGITHSAFRRLVADFGGYGALFTEMLSAKALLNETFTNSPYVRRRPEEGSVFYQLLISDTDKLDATMERLRSFEPAGVDINLACSAPKIRLSRAGAALYEDMPRLATILEKVRCCFSGPLSVKIRLGQDTPGWQERFIERAALFRNTGINAVILHPRFSGQKFRGKARLDLTAWAAETLKLPLIISGDITGPADVAACHSDLKTASGIMIGRMLAVRPWLFASWSTPTQPIDHAETWHRFAMYLAEDFPPDRRLARLKIFTGYFARNFLYGHSFFARVQASKTEEEARSCAASFFMGNPPLDPTPSVRGLN